MNKLVIEFLKSLEDDEKKKFFCEEPSEKTIGKPIPSPRSWEIVSNILDSNLSDLTLLEMIKGAIGKDAATKLIEFKNSRYGITLNYLLADKPIVLTDLPKDNVMRLCIEIRELIKNNFDTYNINDIYMPLGTFINYICGFSEYIKVIFNLQSSVPGTKKLQSILDLYREETSIDLEDRILEGLK